MKTAYTDQDIDITLGRLLRAGVILAAAIVLAGGIVFLVRHGDNLPQYATFHGEPGSFRNISGILRAVFSGSGRAIVQLGLLFLVATPVARVAFSVYAFSRERDHLYTGVTLVVLVLLLFSLFGPHL